MANNVIKVTVERNGRALGFRFNEEAPLSPTKLQEVFVLKLQDALKNTLLALKRQEHQQNLLKKANGG